MNEYIPAPDPLGIPSPTPLFQTLAIITFVLHLIFMNYILGGTLILTIHEWFFGNKPHVAKANSIMVKVMPVALSMAITMGVAPLLFVQVLYGNFFYPANIMMGWFWLAIVGLVTIAFYLIYIMIARRPQNEKSTFTTKLIALVNTLIFFSVAFLFTNNAMLVEHPEYWKAIHAGTASIVVPDNSLWARYAHNVLGAMAVAGLWCACIARYQKRYHPQNADAAHWLHRSGLIWAKGATLLAMIAGIVYLVVMGMDKLKAFMEMNTLFMGWSIAVVLSLVLLVSLVMAFSNEDKPAYLWSSVGIMVLTLIGMAMGREHLRMISLQEYFTFEEFTYNPSHSSLIMFLVTFVIGLGVLAYLVRLIYTLPDQNTNEPQTIPEENQSE